MASRSDGVQQLLSAEKRASEKVGEARKRKARRVKQAKEEATAEVDAYRKERERVFKELEQVTLGSHGDRQAKIDEDTAKQLVEIGQSVVKTKDEAMEKLLALVCDIKPELHMNYQK
jgi:V-type H+-transporting ATPase subunit G